jgi:hypothetical protein
MRTHPRHARPSRRRFATLALATLGGACVIAGVTAAPALAATTEDLRAVAQEGNATTCADVGFPNSTLLFTSGANDSSDANISGDIHDPAPGQFPGFTADSSSLLDVTVDAGVVVDAIVVKAGSQFNLYGPEDAPFTNLRAPLVGAELTNIPAISHWFVCYHLAAGGTTTTLATTTTAAVLGVQVTTSTTAGAQTAATPLARTGSPATYWYLLAGLAFLLGGLSLYGSTIRRVIDERR